MIDDGDSDSFDYDPGLVTVEGKKDECDNKIKDLLELCDDIIIDDADLDEQSEREDHGSQSEMDYDEPVETEDYLLDRAREIYNRMAQSSTFAPRDYQFIVSLYMMELSYEFLERVSNDATTGLYKAIYDRKLTPATLAVIFKFFSIIAVNAYNFGQERALDDLNGCLDMLLDAPNPDYRFLGCQLTAVLLNHVSKLQQSDGSQDVPLPIDFIQDLCMRLSYRQKDISPLVRSLAIESFAKIPIDDFQNKEGEFIRPAQVILKALDDVAIEVRKAAIKHLPLSSSEMLDESIVYLEREQDFQLRRFMAEKLCTSVHFRSFSISQRMMLIHTICKDPHPRVRVLVATLLIPRWLRWLSQEEAVDSRIDVDDETFVPLEKPAYPMALVELLDYLDHEEDSAIAIKCGFSYYMKVISGNSRDIKQFLHGIHQQPKSEHPPGYLHKYNLLKAIVDDDFDLPQRIFILRCFVELIMTQYQGAENLGIRDACISKLLPNFFGLVKLFQIYSERMFSSPDEPSSIQVFVLRQICLLIHAVDLSCSHSRSIYNSSLRKVALDEAFFPTIEMVEFAVDEMWSCMIGNDDYKETLVWMAETSDELLNSVEFRLSEDSDVIISDPKQMHVMLRVATAIHAAVRDNRVGEVPRVLVNTCLRIIPSLAVSLSTQERVLCTKLLTVVGLRVGVDCDFMIHHASKLRHSIEIDISTVREVALSCLADLVIKNGHQSVADRCFPEIESSKERLKSLADIFRNAILTTRSEILHSVLMTTFRLCLFLPSTGLVGSMLYRLFSSAEHTKEITYLEQFFADYVDQKGIHAKVQLLNGFLYCATLSDQQTGFHYGKLMGIILQLFSRDPKEGNELPEELTIETVLLFNILERIDSYPKRESNQALASVCLGSINLDKLSSVYMESLKKKVDSVYQVVESDPRLKAMKISVGQLCRSLLKCLNPMKKTERKVTKKKRKKSEEHTESDPDFLTSATPSSQKRPCTRLSSSSESLHSDTLSSVSPTTDSEEAVMIDDVFNDDDEISLMPPPSISQTRKKPKARSSQSVVY